MGFTVRNLVLIGFPALLGSILITEIIMSVLGSKGINLGKPYQKWVDASLYCEEIRVNSNIYQPINAWSSFVYNAVGLLTLYLTPPPTAYIHNFCYTTDAVRYVFYALLVFLGIASFYFHAAFTFVSGIFDFASMALISSYFAAYSITRWHRRGAVTFFTVFGVIGTTTITLRVLIEVYYGNDFTVPAIVLLLGGSFISETVRQVMFRRWGARRVDPQTGLLIVPIRDFEAQPIPIFAKGEGRLHDEVSSSSLNDSFDRTFYIEDWGWMLWSFGALILALIVWGLDNFNVICFPNQPLQLHA
ncbi:hypothetical protein HK098_003968, partial [Nowakowskiella sp. JEL0407]